MRVKLKLACGEFHFWCKLMVQIFLSIAVAHVHLNVLLRDWPKACLGEYIVYSLTEPNYFLALFPLLCLVWTSGRNSEKYRYPVLLRYRNRNEFFYTWFLAKILFSLAALTVHVGVLFVVGRFLPVISQFDFVSSENLTGIIIRQFLNMFCYVCVMHMLHEILQNIVGNILLDNMLTAVVPLMNLMVVKCMIVSVVEWTPWGHIAYRLFGNERTNYHFYWYYWLFLLLLLIYAADELQGRKDYVFEENYKVN